MPSSAQEAIQIKRIMEGLDCTEQEAREIYASDKAIDRGEPQPFDLPKEVEKAALKMIKASRKKPAVYQFTPRKRKPNPTKEELIASLAKFLQEQQEIETSDVEITNKTRMITFKVGEKKFDLTLIEKRK